MMYALKKDQWEAMAWNLRILLKPGGWLLWEETGYTSWVSLPLSKAINPSRQQAPRSKVARKGYQVAERTARSLRLLATLAG
jgi:hypothetical protein